MASISGWVFEDNVVRFLRHLSCYIEYGYDDHDEAALTGALEQTDDKACDAWFTCPLSGTPSLMVSLAQVGGGTVVSVRVDGDIDPVLAARVDTLLDLL